MLAVAQGADPVLPEAHNQLTSEHEIATFKAHSPKHFGHTTSRHWGVQDMPDIDHFLRKPNWNESNALPLHQWLCNERGHEHKPRMDTLGNMVVPQQAFLAMSVLGRMQRGDYF